MTAFVRTALLERGEPFEIEVDGRPVRAYPGDSVAAALLAAGILAFDGAPATSLRSVFCGMGACFGCLVTVDGLPNVRSCTAPARPGLRVELTRHAHD